uniref:Uncharacterized protein n=1 Tax=Candidatus Kentrum eta TaxID=2126337 RepID=A0A450VC48_9GAMM|nr:MAG: hypothetical protein BECKH772B_GA0070898_102763 [Candidatus Kentron sp. H]VFK02436.1 MAG: hypothetical protein BECKH772A_GA0070896_102693 [Candidatus Kentron sp. H]VFK05436.1 MAG: hypothetical protein BECKH772C_GA0070978_102713 [Candidatus Kentron sp. H]
MNGPRRAVSTPIRATGRWRLIGVRPWVASIVVLLLGCAAPDSVESSNSGQISVAPMVRLQKGISTHHVTGYIAKKEWKDSQVKNRSKCWEALLLTFNVFHSRHGSSKCTKKGISPEIVNTNGKPKVVIDATCLTSEKHPPIRVRICQSDRPGNLLFDYEETDAPTTGTSQTIKAEHFKVNDKQATLLDAFLEPKQKRVYFYLNDSESAAKAADAGRIKKEPIGTGTSTGGDSLNTFLPLLGKDLFVDTYAEALGKPTGRGVIWPDPSQPHAWADPDTVPHHVRIHSKLGVMECIPPTDEAWKQLELADCFGTVKLPPGMGDHHLYLDLAAIRRNPCRRRQGVSRQRTGTDHTDPANAGQQLEGAGPDGSSLQPRIRLREQRHSR